MDLKKLKGLEKKFTKLDEKYDNLHIICFNSEKLTEELKNSLKAFSEEEVKRYGEIEDVVFVNNKEQEPEVRELFGLDFHNFFAVIIGDEVQAVYPLEGESLKIIQQYN